MTKIHQPIRVLYVDDNRLDRELVAHALAAEPGLFVLTEAASKKELRARLRQGEFDVVLSDFNILGFDGFDVVDLVREKRPGIPIILVTGTGSEEIAVEAMRRGVSDYVIKSVKHIKRLPHTILAAVEKKRVEDSLEARSDELRALAAELSMAEERERRRLASDLHDTVGQSLALAQMKLGELESSAPSPQRAQALAEVRKIVRECLGVVRSLAFELSPPVLSELGLGPALKWLSRWFQDEHGLSVEVRKDRDWGDREPPDEAVRQFLPGGAGAAHERAKALRGHERRHAPRKTRGKTAIDGRRLGRRIRCRGARPEDRIRAPPHPRARPPPRRKPERRHKARWRHPSHDRAALALECGTFDQQAPTTSAALRSQLSRFVMPSRTANLVSSATL